MSGKSGKGATKAVSKHTYRTRILAVYYKHQPLNKNWFIGLKFRQPLNQYQIQESNMLNKIKQFLPGSSRSLHSMHEDLHAMHEDFHAMHEDVFKLCEEVNRLYQRIEMAENGINYQFDARVIPMIESLTSDVDAHDEHMKMFAWENYRQQGESVQEAKERFFRTLPKATGGLRLLQLGCGKLLGEFDALCKEHNINYWINFGTLIGAIRHQGFIPWDDDTDLGIMRDDLDRLQEIVKHDTRYKITLIYDRYVHCRQVRFLYNDENIPCFLDLFIYDWAPSTDNKYAEQQRELRKQMINEMDSNDELSFWQNEPCYSGIKNSLIQAYYDRYIELSKEAGFICEKEQAKAIMWSIDNLDDGKQKQWVYPINDLFPTKSMPFEGNGLEAPNRPETFLWSRYGDIYKLPNDINSHFEHVDHNSLETSLSNQAMKSLLES